MEEILMKLEKLETVGCNMMNTHAILLTFKAIKFNIEYKVLTNKLRHHIKENNSLNELMEIYEK